MQMIDPKSKSNLAFVSQLAYDQMQRIPTVDAEPVVRCKDCLYWESAIGFCHQNSQYYNGGESWDIYQPDDFCSRGERRTT
jgi:hypothetical protein